MAESTQSLSHEVRVTRVQNRPMFGARCLFPPQFPRHGLSTCAPGAAGFRRNFAVLSQKK